MRFCEIGRKLGCVIKLRYT